VCPSMCPATCCKKDMVHYIEAKSVISEIKADKKCNCKGRCAKARRGRKHGKRCWCDNHCENVI
jgi:hypothetical protein